jgi:protein-L-isoaspartate(D-aspartate) O-methyltransferase
MDNEESRFAQWRKEMVEQQLRGRGICDECVLDAMLRIPRHRFVDKEMRCDAYGDYPLPIGFGQTISQPYIVALMTELAQPFSDARALEVGTGSGYQAAVLAELCKEVFGIELVKPLAQKANALLKELGYTNAHVQQGDGYFGWPEHAPFDVIVVAAAPPQVPQPLVEQLAPGGRMVIPVGELWQDLLVVEKDQEGRVHECRFAPVAFVPMRERRNLAALNKQNVFDGVGNNVASRGASVRYLTRNRCPV